jgi:hypothetical protein
MLARICCALALIVTSATVVPAQMSEVDFSDWYIDCFQPVGPDYCYIRQTTGEGKTMVSAVVTFNVYLEPEIEIRVPPSATTGVIALGFSTRDVQSMSIDCDTKACRTSFRIGKGWITQLLAHDRLWIAYRLSDTEVAWTSLDVEGLDEAIRFVLGAKT